MIEVYSDNVTVAENGAVPFNNIILRKGCTAVESAPASINLNKCGIYMVSCDASVSVEGDTDGVALQLSKNNVLQPQAISSATGEEGDTVSLGFVTLVQVSESNSCGCCTSPTIIQVINVGEDVTIEHVNVCVTKIC